VSDVSRQDRAIGAGEGFVRISNRELYDMMVQVRDRVGRLEARVDSVLTENVTNARRIRALELKVYTILAGVTSVFVAGGLALVSGAFGG
jgi:hypothetical protein